MFKVKEGLIDDIENWVLGNWVEHGASYLALEIENKQNGEKMIRLVLNK